MAISFASSPPPERTFSHLDLVPAIPGAMAALFAVWAVHRLTKGREREKAVFDLHKIVTEQVAAVSAAATGAWTAARGPERTRSIAETKWRLQQLGATLERMRVFSSRRRWIALPPRRLEEINTRAEMVEFRRAVTADPFEDPLRRATKTKLAHLEISVGGFLSEVEQKIFSWVR